MTAVAAISSDNVWATGQAPGQSLRPTPLAERWDGHAWRRVTVP
jgi:hypothetical protein